jgi:hypothetical protein
MKTNIKIFIGVIILLFLGTITSIVLQSGDVSLGSGRYDAFATCLKEKGAVFYGAWWCSHCNATKKLFGLSKKLLPYVECSSTDGTQQLQVCKDKKIESYPTWEFADGSRLTGEVSLEQLVEKTSCPLPQ